MLFFTKHILGIRCENSQRNLQYWNIWNVINWNDVWHTAKCEKMKKKKKWQNNENWFPDMPRMSTENNNNNNNNNQAQTGCKLYSIKALYSYSRLIWIQINRRFSTFGKIKKISLWNKCMYWHWQGNYMESGNDEKQRASQMIFNSRMAKCSEWQCNGIARPTSIEIMSEKWLISTCLYFYTYVSMPSDLIFSYTFRIFCFR